MAPKPCTMDPSPPPSREQQQRQYTTIKNNTTKMSNNNININDNREQQHRSGGRSSSRRQLATSVNSMTNNNEGGSSSSSRQQHPSAAHLARQQQRRRPTNYTSSYTPSPELVAQHHAASAAPHVKSTSTSRRKCSSLDRSEEEGDVRRRHLKSGAIAKPSSSSSSTQQQKQQQQLPTVNEPYNEASKVIGGFSEQVQLRRDQLQLQAMQAQLRLEREQQQQLQQSRGGGGGQVRGDSSNNKGYERSGTVKSSGSSSKNRRSSQDYKDNNNRGGSSSSSGHGGSGSTSRKSSSSSSRRSSKESSSSSSNKHTTTTNNNNEVDDTSERAEQQRIEEYAGKRALLRLEQELADHSESNNRDNNNNLRSQQSSRSKSPGGYSSGTGDESYKSVMDRKKLARVPQVKKSDLIIGEYLGRGNFCDVFEVTWIPAEQRTLTSLNFHTNNNSSSSRTYTTYDGIESDESNRSLENSMESLALSCSNDLNLVINDQRNGGLTRSASRRSVSQVVSSAYTSSGNGGGMSSRGFSGSGIGSSSMMMNGMNSGLRNPNVLALKCLRPAVRAQPRKFVIGAEDLAHETALLACLDHPNIIQLYGRAEGCFSTAFQMRNKGSSGSTDPSSGGGSKGGGKQMSNEGYFIILDRLMTTLTDRIEEWKDECRAINGVGPPPATGLPPESTLREHLCKRLKVAYCIADALEYLHSRHVVFRDLKPANVGFDCNDCVKMFDFGFATSIAPLLSQPYEGYGPLTETCGTRRYMATEVALKLGYGKEVDVYSFGMLLWEICALDKPFDSIQSVDEFHDLVVLCGRRPSLNIDPLWTPSLKNLMSRCWSTDPLDRPTMVQVKSLLCNVLRDMNKAMEKSSSGRGVSGAGGTGTQQQRQEQGGNFIHKWRRRVSI